MFDKNINGNLNDSFDGLIINEINKYVYALRDPRDNKIFYVGQGTDERLFDHFNEARDSLANNRISSSKVIRILDIWKNEEDVDWFIVAHSLTDESANIVESAVYNSLSESQNGLLLNDINPPASTMLSQEEIGFIGAQGVNPENEINNVFVFPIKNALSEGVMPYEATRCCWLVTAVNRGIDNAKAVGLNNGVSVSSYTINGWERSYIENKYCFNGENYDELNGVSWGKVLSYVKGYWQRGNYLIVSFDGRGHFMIRRGAGDRNNRWVDCT